MNQTETAPWRKVLPQVLAVCVKNVLLIGFGMTLGFPTILIPSLSSDSNKTTGSQLVASKETISWIGSINLICVPLGCIFSGMLTQPWGRKRAMQLVNLPFIVAWLLFYFASEMWHVLLALCLTGFTGGLLEAPVLTYVAEITQPHLRGILSSTSTMAVILGILYQFLLGTFFPWQQVALANCSIPILGFVLLFFVPETPLWLIGQNRFLDARKSIAWLRGWTSLAAIEEEFKDQCKQLGNACDIECSRENAKSDHSNTKSKPTMFSLLMQKSFLWPYLLVSLTFFLGHFSGMTTLQTYAVRIFEALHSPIDKYYATIILGAVELLGCIACVILVHIMGKRALTFISLVGCGVCFFIVASYARLINTYSLQPNTDSADIDQNWIPLTFLISSAFLSHFGIKVLPWILIGEVFSNETRATASGLSAALGYVLGFLANKLFLSMISVLTLPGTFWLYSAVSFGGAILMFFVLPETEGKTLFEISEHFAGRQRLNNNIQRHKTGVNNPAFHMEESYKPSATRL